jgi:hypothetical protein
MKEVREMGFMMICDRCTKPITNSLDDRSCQKLVVSDKKGASPKDIKQSWSAELCKPCSELVKDFIFDHKE